MDVYVLCLKREAGRRCVSCEVGRVSVVLAGTGHLAIECGCWVASPGNLTLPGAACALQHAD